MTKEQIGYVWHMDKAHRDHPLEKVYELKGKVISNKIQPSDLARGPRLKASKKTAKEE